MDNIHNRYPTKWSFHKGEISMPEVLTAMATRPSAVGAVELSFYLVDVEGYGVEVDPGACQLQQQRGLCKVEQIGPDEHWEQAPPVCAQHADRLAHGQKGINQVCGIQRSHRTGRGSRAAAQQHKRRDEISRTEWKLTRSRSETREMLSSFDLCRLD